MSWSFHLDKGSISHTPLPSPGVSAAAARQAATRPAPPSNLHFVACLCCSRWAFLKKEVLVLLWGHYLNPLAKIFFKWSFGVRILACRKIIFLSLKTKEYLFKICLKFATLSVKNRSRTFRLHLVLSWIFYSPNYQIWCVQSFILSFETEIAQSGK